MDYKAIVDAQMSKYEEMGKQKEQGNLEEDPEIDPFFAALLSNEKFKSGICNTMEQVSQKFAGAVMSSPNSAQELKELLSTTAMARPILGMVYTGFLMGKTQGESDSMEKMFGSMELDMKETN